MLLISNLIALWLTMWLNGIDFLKKIVETLSLVYGQYLNIPCVTEEWVF